MKSEYAGPDDRLHKIRPAKMWDHHGRRYGAVLDKSNGIPIGRGPRPDGWRAPWMPGQEWFRYHEDETNPMKFRIDYESMLESSMAAHEAYDRQWTDYAVGNGWDPKDEAMIGRIVAKIGPRPLPFELIVAAMQGNKYILGLTEKVDKRVEPFLRMRPKYTRTAKKQEILSGLDFTDHDDDEDLEERMDLQEQHDPEDTPRGRVPVKSKRQKKAPEPDLAA